MFTYKVSFRLLLAGPAPAVIGYHGEKKFSPKLMNPERDEFREHDTTMNKYKY